MATNSKISYIVDRHEGIFIIMYRDGSELGKIYHRPSPASLKRLAIALRNGLLCKRMLIRQMSEQPKVYSYTPIYR